ncbi:MAG: phosphotransferase [Actinomycetota bacterium]
MSAFPETPDQVDTDWLSQVLGAPVSSVRAENLGEGVGVMAEVTRLHLEGEDVPATLVLKTASPAEENRQVAGAYGFYEREVSFYRELSPDVDVRVPRCHHAEMAPGGVPFVILMEEITGARAVDQLEGCSEADAVAIVDTVAALHASWWESPELERLDWLPGMDNAAYRAYAEVLPALVPVLRAKAADLDDTPQAWLDQLAGGRYPAYLAWWSNGPLTFCHYDLRLDNVLFGVDDGDGVCLLDWQLSLRHRGTFDLSYFLGQNVPTEFRREHQDALLRRYHDRLVDLGVHGYSFERCWDDYRAGMLMHVASAPQLAALDGGNERGQALLDSMLERGWQAAVDLDAGFVIDEL